jgi:hypothetical protein
MFSARLVLFLQKYYSTSQDDGLAGYGFEKSSFG